MSLADSVKMESLPVEILQHVAWLALNPELYLVSKRISTRLEPLSLFEEDLCQTIDTLLRYGCSLAECRDYLLTLYLALAHELNQFSCIRQYKQSNRASNLHLLASYAEVSSSSLGVRRPHVAGMSSTELVAFSWNFDVKDSGSLHFSGI